MSAGTLNCSICIPDVAHWPAVANTLLGSTQTVHPTGIGRYEGLVRLEARPPNAEGAGGVPVRALVRAALRMRPDRIVVGEVRGGEAFDLLQALNTGHDGSLTTVHANGVGAVVDRLTSLVLLAGTGVPASAAHLQIAEAVDFVVHVVRRDGRRRVQTVAEVRRTADGVRVDPVFVEVCDGEDQDCTDGDFEAMAAQLLRGDARENARRVQLRFNQLGLRVRS